MQGVCDVLLLLVLLYLRDFIRLFLAVSILSVILFSALVVILMSPRQSTRLQTEKGKGGGEEKFTLLHTTVGDGVRLICF